MDKHSSKVYALDDDESEPTKGWGVELRALTRVVQGKQKDRWERDAGGVATIKDKMENKFFSKTGEERVQAEREKETKISSKIHASRKGKGK